MVTGVLFTVFFLGLLIMALARHPIFGLYAYLATFYVHPPSRWWSAYVPDLRWAFLAAGVTLIAVMLNGRRNADAPERPGLFSYAPAIILAAYTLWLWVQNFWALSPEAQMRASIHYTKFVVALYLVWKIADTPQRVNAFLLAHVAGCFYLSWLAFRIGLGGGSRLDGVGGPGIDDANTLSMFLATGVITAVAFLLHERGWRWWCCLLAIPFILNAMIMASSRGAILGIAAGAAAIFFLRPPERKSLLWILATLGIGLSTTLMDKRFLDRMFTVGDALTQSENIDNSAASRWVLIKAQMQMAQDYPAGAGHRGTAVLSPMYLDTKYLAHTQAYGSMARSSHNTLMTTYVEQGYPGLIMYLWLTLWIIVTALSVKRMNTPVVPMSHRLGPVACSSALAVVWVAGQTADYLLAEVQIWMFALLISSRSWGASRQTSITGLTPHPT